VCFDFVVFWFRALTIKHYNGVIDGIDDIWYNDIDGVNDLF